jgi:predicted NBD/HSP70 family sugar kinase
MGPSAGSLRTLRELNRVRIVDELRRCGTASRSELARLTGLSRTTVASLVDELRERGLVVEYAREARPAGPGRPAALLRLDASAGAVVGVDFGHRHLRVAVADLSSTVLAERRADVDVDHDAADALDAAAELVEAVLGEAGVARSRVVGVGMGVPGPVDRRTGIVGTSILPRWAGINAAGELAARVGVRVEADNDANLGALAEVSFGAGRGLEDVVYVKVASGIGAGLVLGGRLYHGATGGAGELGHVQVRPEGSVCRCGNRGCLETVAGAGALLDLLRPAHGGELSEQGLLELVAAGDLGARRVVNDAGRAIGRVLADLCNHVNPAAVVVGGELAAAGATLLDAVREEIDRYAQPGAAQAVTVVRGALGERAEVLGALALVIGDPDRLGSVGLAALGPLPAAATP